MLDDELREEPREFGIARPKRPGEQQVALRQADEDASGRAELAREVLPYIGQEDAGGIVALAGVGRQEATIARNLVGPRRAGRPGREVGDRGVLDVLGADAPGKQVVAVHDDVEPVGRHRVDDRDAARALVEERLGVRLARGFGAMHLGLGDRHALRADRPERGDDEGRRGAEVVLRCHRRGGWRMTLGRVVPAHRRVLVDGREDLRRGVPDRLRRAVSHVAPDVAAVVAAACAEIALHVLSRPRSALSILPDRTG